MNSPQLIQNHANSLQVSACSDFAKADDVNGLGERSQWCFWQPLVCLPTPNANNTTKANSRSPLSWSSFHGLVNSTLEDMDSTLNQCISQAQHSDFCKFSVNVGWCSWLEGLKRKCPMLLFGCHWFIPNSGLAPSAPSALLGPQLPLKNLLPSLSLIFAVKLAWNPPWYFKGWCFPGNSISCYWEVDPYFLIQPIPFALSRPYPTWGVAPCSDPFFWCPQLQLPFTISLIVLPWWNL